MRRVCLTLWVVFVSVAFSAVAGDVWINCSPGHDVFLDGESVGVSAAAESGKSLRGIEPGDHTIRIENNGIALAEFSVKVGFLPIQVEVGELAAGTTSESPETSLGVAEIPPVGTVEIISDPAKCNVKIGKRRIVKRHPIMTIPSIPVGEHKMWFESAGTVLSKKIVVQAVQPVRITVDFQTQQVALAEEDPAVEGGEPVDKPEYPEAEPGCIEYWIEVLRADSMEDIESYQQLLKELGFPREQHRIITVEQGSANPEFKLRVGPIPRKNKAKWAAGLIRNAGIPTVWVVPEECESDPRPKPKRKFRPSTSVG